MLFSLESHKPLGRQTDCLGKQGEWWMWQVQFFFFPTAWLCLDSVCLSAAQLPLVCILPRVTASVSHAGGILHALVVSVHSFPWEYVLSLLVSSEFDFQVFTLAVNVSKLHKFHALFIVNTACDVICLQNILMF